MPIGPYILPIVYNTCPIGGGNTYFQPLPWTAGDWDYANFVSFLVDGVQGINNASGLSKNFLNDANCPGTLFYLRLKFKYVSGDSGTGQFLLGTSVNSNFSGGQVAVGPFDYGSTPRVNIIVGGLTVFTGTFVLQDATDYILETTIEIVSPGSVKVTYWLSDGMYTALLESNTITVSSGIGNFAGFQNFGPGGSDLKLVDIWVFGPCLALSNTCQGIPLPQPKEPKMSRKTYGIHDDQMRYNKTTDQIEILLPGNSDDPTKTIRLPNNG